jgi:hypothetical protein
MKRLFTMLFLLSTAAVHADVSQNCKDRAQKLYEKVSKAPNEKIDKAMKEVFSLLSEAERLKLESQQAEIKRINESIERLVKENEVSKTDSDKARNDQLNDLRKRYSEVHTEGTKWIMDLLNTKYSSDVAKLFVKMKNEEGVKGSIAGNQLQFSTLFREDGDNQEYLISRRDYLDAKKEWHGFRVVTKDEGKIASINLSHESFLYPQTPECSDAPQVAGLSEQYSSTYKYLTGEGNNSLSDATGAALTGDGSKGMH